MSSSRKRRGLAAFGAGALALTGVLLAPGTAGASGAPSPSVVASGLNNPRQLNFDSMGRLLVAEAGRGGSTCIGSGEDETCIGLTGAVSRITMPTKNDQPVQRVLTGFPSAAGPDGSFAVGSDGVDAVASSIFVAETYAPPDAVPPDFIPASVSELLGKLLKSVNGGAVSIKADISGAEIRLNPDKGAIDSNPYSVLAQRNRVLVADAAANAVFVVYGSTVRVFHVFADEDGHQFVPTSLAEDGSGNIYVGGLGGEAPGAGKVVKLSSTGQVLKTWRGFTTVTGVAVDRHGVVYVSQLFLNKVTAVRGSGRTDVDVPWPAGLAVDAKGRVYVSAYSVSTANGSFGPGSAGQIWRFSHF